MSNNRKDHKDSLISDFKEHIIKSNPSNASLHSYDKTISPKNFKV